MPGTQKKFSDFVLATDFTGIDEFPFLQGGINKKIAGGIFLNKIEDARVSANSYADSLFSSATNAVESVFGRIGIVTAQVGDYTTDQVTEGTNLYYTQSRFDSAFTAKSTTNLSEGTNLYYTQSRFDSAFTAKSTTNLSEGTNLYYTNARGINSTLTGYTSGAGVVSSADSILQAIQKLNGNTLLKATLSGADTQIQYNNAGVMGASANFAYSSALSKLTVNAKIDQNFSETGAASFTLTNGTTAINAGVITYDPNTVIKVGDVVTGPGLAAQSIVYEIISSASARVSNHCISANTGVTFTVTPSHVGAYFKYNFTKTPNNQLGAAVIIEATSNDISRGLIVINRDGASSNQVATEIMAKGNHLWLTAPDNIGNLGTTWYLESGSGSGTSNGNFGFGKVVSSTRTSLFQITQGSQMQWNGTASITSSGNLGLQATTQVAIAKANATVTPTSGNTNFLVVGFDNLTSANYYWNPASGNATLNVVTANPSITQSGSATGGANLFNATPTTAVIAAGGYLRGYYANINAGTGTIHQLYLQGTAPSYLNGVVGFNTLTPNVGCQVDIVSTTLGVGLPATTGALITANSTARTGTVMYQTDGTEGLMVKKSSGWSAIGGGSTDYIFSFQKSGSLTYSTLNVDGGSPAFTNVMGFVIPKAMSVQDISVIFGTSSASSAGTVSFIIKKYSVGVGNAGTGSPIALGAGTTVATISSNSGGALGVAYFRNAVSLGVGASLSAGDVIWVETNNFTGWNITDVKLELRCN
jgi:hypothetical protein